jgi:non-specific serine/threonine protein kinase
MITTETADCVPLSIPRRFGNYIAHKVIAQGTTSVVIDASDRITGQAYAVKVMSRNDLENRKIIPLVERELAILRRLSHEHVLKFREFLRNGDLLFFVTDSYVGGDLFSWILENRIDQLSTLKRLFYDVLLAVQYLHSQGIAHNDIKPENVVVDGTGRAVLVDFGYAKDFLFAGDNAKSGTLMYAAPELFRPGPYQTQKADIWSLAILLYAMATREFPFVGEEEHKIVRQIIRGKLRFPQNMDHQVKALVRRMAKVNPNKRPTIESVLEDRFFDDVCQKRPLSVPPFESEIDVDLW